MSSPATHIFRLPSEADALKIVNDAKGKPIGSEEVKALRNLYKALDWAYKGLEADQKTQVKGKLANIESDLLAEINGKKATLDAIAVLKVLVVANPDLQHSGAQRLKPLDPAQDKTIKDTIDRLKTHVEAIDRGDHDALIEQIFPPVPGKIFKSWVTPSPKKEVATTFKEALAAVERLYKAKAITVDSYGPAIKAGGLTNPTRLALAPKFFAETDNEREAVLGHESTHAIDGSNRTNDKGGYIGSQMFQSAENAERLKNAAHYEAVLRLINGETLPQVATLSGAIKEANEIVREAWDKSINLYLMLQEYSSKNGGLVTNEGQIEAVMTIAMILGLPAYKKAAKPAQIKVTDADLAFAENRVGKLGILIGGAVDRAATDVQAKDPPVTKEKILAKLVELEGPIRKTTKNQKTVDMIMLLADFGPQQVEAFRKKTYK